LEIAQTVILAIKLILALLEPSLHYQNICVFKMVQDELVLQKKLMYAEIISIYV